uniref:hydroxyethylthiazole kinase n=1 Tax=Tessaracoccus timonensis TaxID=2161816 RepID=UPI000D54D2C0|nr:hydroxyethylthiazole kinase [Tessaracoccus timonensis]
MTDWQTVVRSVRGRAPLVHCISATVSMGLVADGLLAAGARPMMTETLGEAPAMTAMADALLVGFGTLSTDAVDGIPPTVDAAIAAGHPWVLDPTAIGVPPVRTAMARGLVAKGPTVVRCNASECLALAQTGPGGRGADATASVDEAADAAAALARRWGSIVAVSGVSDLVTDGATAVRIDGGSPLLPRVTGTGCLLGALTAASCVVAEPLHAAVAAATWLKRASEVAETRAAGPGTFRMHLKDALDEVGR